MRGRRWVALAATVAIAMAGTTVMAAAQNKGEAPKATDVGITDSEIHIAVVADVDTPLAPGLFQGSPNALAGFQKYINGSCKPKNTCLAGRKVVVDFIDSHLSPTESRNAMIKACAEDFAVVGTAALFLNNVDDMVACKDQAGAATGLPEIPILSTEVAQQCSPVSFGINPPQLDCSTKDQHPQTFRANRGTVRYYLKHRNKNLHGLFLYSNDVKSAQLGGESVIKGQIHGGVKADLETGVSALATQAAYTPFVQQMKDKQSNFGLSMGPFSSTVALRKEAKLQGINSDDVVWDCFSQCYDKGLIEQGGADVEGQYVTLSQIPFEEASKNKALANYIKFTGKSKIDGFGAYAWIAALLFRDSVNAIVKQGGTNALTRKALLDQLAATKRFNADGMWGTTDIGDHIPSSCFLVMQVQGGKFKRVYPSKPGTFDCKKSNRIELQEDLID